MNTFFEYDIESAGKYHSWYESAAGKEIGEGQREALKQALGEPASRQLLDVGCGTGYFTKWFQMLGFNVTGIDSSEAMINFARKKYGSTLEFRIGDAMNLPFNDKSFDVLVFAASLEFIPDTVPAAREAERVARSEIILLLLNPDHPMNIKRMERDASRGGVFSSARIRRPEEVKVLFEGTGQPHWTGSCAFEPDNSSYYVMKMIHD